VVVGSQGTAGARVCDPQKGGNTSGVAKLDVPRIKSVAAGHRPALRERWGERARKWRCHREPCEL